MMTSRKLLITMFALALVMGIAFSGAQPTQSKGAALDTLSLTLSFPPTDRAIRARDFTSIRGTLHVPAGCLNTRVKISLGKNESDEEWACSGCAPGSSTGGTYRWMTGPTGQWLPTGVSGGTRWAAPTAAYRLPSGANLPDGAYVIIAYAEGERAPQSSDTCKTEQQRWIFKVNGR